MSPNRPNAVEVAKNFGRAICQGHLVVARGGKQRIVR